MEGRKAEFKEGQRAGEKEAMQLDALKIAFSKGRMEGFSMGMGVGRDEEEERWKGAGHFEGGECHLASGVAATCAVKTTPPSPTTTDDSANIMSLLMVSTGQTTPTRPSRFTPHHQLPGSLTISRTYAQARKTCLIPCNNAIHDITDLGQIQFDDDNSILHHRRSLRAQ
jgi:hypothetical protein